MNSGDVGPHGSAAVTILSFSVAGVTVERGLRNMPAERS